MELCLYALHAHRVFIALHRLAPPASMSIKKHRKNGENSKKNPKTGAPGEARTLNLLIRSQALYPLSYGGSIGIIHEDFFPCLSDELQGRIDAFT